MAAGATVPRDVRRPERRELGFVQSHPPRGPKTMISGAESKVRNASPRQAQSGACLLVDKFICPCPVTRGGWRLYFYGRLPKDHASHGPLQLQPRPSSTFLAVALARLIQPYCPAAGRTYRARTRRALLCPLTHGREDLYFSKGLLHKHALNVP